MERRSVFPTNQPHGIVGVGQDARPTGIDLRHKTVDFGKSTYSRAGTRVAPTETEIGAIWQVSIEPSDLPFFS